ncbi:protein-L-isoaspartate(D-aspartate) O-methyltransferase [Zavarzinia compransoris]|uniref:Protein-L-isoaspartate O-methyltransferase n=1 Tax=Zavarzinia compransoris TaxID=1264899 RepID=A0A317E9S2_9PROT|nr:protein-L-isoaspartate(D-aspartate) O-methyltransferase [Zavarzinia compransoris]PWR23669.1 protein-L-isoaspartate O-methyltransferase [Zavarzinia compransoris]TDP47887.1 protein-L-isoaspartate(D-aspartate) O-methyltransferase [Zavarzinia compransoris]
MGTDTEKASLILSLRQQGIVDLRVLGALESIPRERFVPPALAHKAFEDTALPIAGGQTISQPFIVAYMTQALDVGPRHKVLEIGTGSGYQAGVLARLCRRVYTVERRRALLRQAERLLTEIHIHNVVTRLGDGTKGWPEQAPFDRIMVTAAAPKVPQALIDQLAEGGIMVLPVGPQHGDQEIWRVRREGAEALYEKLLPVRFVPLVEGILRDD